MRGHKIPDETRRIIKRDLEEYGARRVAKDHHLSLKVIQKIKKE